MKWQLTEPWYLDTPEMVEGAPCGFQILGRPMRDEELLQVAGIVQGCLRAK